MKKLIFKFWILNLFLSFALYIGYRVMLSNTETEETNTFEFIMYILKTLLDLYTIALFLLVMIICSFTYFLNLNDKIRNNGFLSYLTFLGIPIAIVLYYFVAFNSDFRTAGFEGFKLMKTNFVVSFVYIFFATVLFLFFRQKIKKI